VYYFKSNNSQNTSIRFIPFNQENIGQVWRSLRAEQKRSSDFVLTSKERNMDLWNV